MKGRKTDKQITKSFLEETREDIKKRIQTIEELEENTPNQTCANYLNNCIEKAETELEVVENLLKRAKQE